MKIKICKLVDGSLVIGCLTETLITDVVEIYIKQLESGQQVLLVPVLYPFNQSFTGIEINVNKILLTIDPNKDLINEYLKQTQELVPANFSSEPTKPKLEIVKNKV